MGSQHPKPSALFSLTSIAAMLLITAGAAELAATGLREGQADLMLAEVCFPLGLFHVGAIFWSLFHRGLSASRMALGLYWLELPFLGLAFVTGLIESLLNHKNALSFFLVVFWVLCIVLSGRWLRRLEAAKTSEASQTDGDIQDP